MITEKISLVSPGDLPGRILESVEEAQTFAAIQGYRGNGHRVNQTANAINLADALQIREGGNWGQEARAILRGGEKLVNSPKMSPLIHIFADAIGTPRGSAPKPVAEAAYLADAVGSQQGRNAGQGMVVEQPGTGQTMARLVQSAPYSDAVPVLGQDLMTVMYVEGAGKAGFIDSMRSTPENEAQVAQTSIKIRVLAIRDSVDPLRIARAANANSGLGYDRAAAQARQSESALMGLMRNVAIEGAPKDGLNGLMSVTGTGKGVEVDKTTVDVATASAADVARAVRNVIDTAILAGDGYPPDTVTLDTLVISRLREAATSGGSELEVMIKAYQSAGITNWFEMPNLGTSASRRGVLVSSLAQQDATRLISAPTPNVFTFPNGANTETYRLWSCGGIWTPISAFHHVGVFDYSP